MKTVLLAGHAPAQNQAWIQELQASGDWRILGPVQSFGAARVLLLRMLACGRRLGDIA